jgi:hypothetical protein
MAAATVAAARCRSSALRRASSGSISATRAGIGPRPIRIASASRRSARSTWTKLGVDRLLVVIGILPPEARDRLGHGVVDHGRVQYVSLQGV